VETETLAEGRRADYLRWSAMLNAMRFDRLTGRPRRDGIRDGQACHLQRSTHRIFSDGAFVFPPVLNSLLDELWRAVRELPAQPTR
jgi:hypothetical protein